MTKDNTFPLTRINPEGLLETCVFNLAEVTSKGFDIPVRVENYYPLFFLNLDEGELIELPFVPMRVHELGISKPGHYLQCENSFKLWSAVFRSVEWLPSRMSLIDLVRGKKIALWHKVPSMPDMGGGDEW